MHEHNRNINSLTESDINKLLQSPIDKKIDITKKIADYYNQGGFDNKQVEIVQHIFRTLVNDVEVEMRTALAESLKNTDSIPSDIVKKLAYDVTEVSLPILEFSDVLSDEDLIEIVHTSKDTAKQIAISKRETVSQELSTALIETENPNVVGSLLNNKGADISEKGYKKIIDDHNDKEAIMGAIIEKKNLPVTIIESLSSTISDSMCQILSEKYSIAFEKIRNVVEHSRELAALKVIGLKSTEREYRIFKDIMNKLQVSEELTPVYALCMGNLNIFEVIVARNLKAPLQNIRKLTHDASNLGIQAICKRINIPENLNKPVEILVDTLRDYDEELKEHSLFLPNEITNRIIESITEKASAYGEESNMDYIISLIQYSKSIKPQGDKHD